MPSENDKADSSPAQSSDSSSNRPHVNPSHSPDDLDTSSSLNPMNNAHRRMSLIPSAHFPPNYHYQSKINRPPKSIGATNEAIAENEEFSSESLSLPTKSDPTDLIKLKSNQDEDEDDLFDQLILTLFTEFSGTENVVIWLQETEKKFNRLKFSRKQRFLAIPLLVGGIAKTKYVKNRDQIQSFDDFYAYLLTNYEKSVGFVDKSSSTSRNIDSFSVTSTYLDQTSTTPKLHSHSTLNHSHFSPQPPVLRSTALGDLSFGPNTSVPISSRTDPQLSNSMFSLNNTTNDLRKAVLESFIKTPKTFHGGNDDVNKWLEELDHLFNLAHIPDVNKLDLMSYALKGDALQWYKNTKSVIITWDIFVQELKKAFTSSYQQELSFKKLESYGQGPHQSIRNYYNETLKLCDEADPAMTESTKLKHLLSKAKPSIQFEVRRKKPTTPVEFLEYAREAEELFQLSGMTSDNYSPSSAPNSSSIREITDSRPLPADSDSLRTNTSTSTHHAQVRSSETRSPTHPRFTSTFNAPKPPPETYPTGRNHDKSSSHRQFSSTPTHPSQKHSSTHYSSTNANTGRPPMYPRTASHISPLMNSNVSYSPSTPDSSNRSHQTKSSPVHRSSLIFLSTSVNDKPMKILIDTGATTTFISEISLFRISPPLHLQPNQSSFVLADGIAPFETIGMVDLSILFADQPTPIRAYVVPNLCADLIIGMDYIHRYYLNINIADQLLSITLHGRIFYMSIDSRSSAQVTPVVLPDPIHFSHYASIPVTIPVAWANCFFVPHQDFQMDNPVIATMDLFQTQKRFTNLKLINLSSTPYRLKKGTQIGYLVKSPTNQPIIPVICMVSSSDDDATSCGMSSDPPGEDHQTNHNPTLFDRCHPLPAHLQQLIARIDSQTARDRLASLLFRYRQVFDTSKHNIASTTVSHVIRTIPHSPPASKPYPSPDKEESLYRIIEEFLAAGLISESNSPYAAPAILVKKNDGSHRLVVDYKKLNLITIKDSSPLPNMEDVLRKLGHGYRFFSKLDLKSGFYQIPIQEQDKLKTAFVTPFGLYHFNVLPMGLRNSPPTFQKVMTDALKSCRTFSLVYLDDIVVFSSSFDEHIIHLEKVFLALRAKNIVLNPPKCTLATEEIDYLGHTVSASIV